MIIFHFLNRFLRKTFGYGLHKTPSHLHFPPNQKRNQSLVIEFMGPSGTGKTTLRDYYLKNKKLPIKNIITEKDLKEFDFYPHEIENSNLGIYDDLFSYKLKGLSAKEDNFIKENRKIQLYHKTLMRDFIIRTYLKSKIVILDQHVFKFFTTTFLKIENTSSKKEFLKNRIIIYCHASPHKIVENIEKRAKAGRPRLTHLGKDNNQLLSGLEKYLTNRQLQIQGLQKLGVNLIEINTEKSLAENADILDDFLRKHLQKQN